MLTVALALSLLTPTALSAAPASDPPVRLKLNDDATYAPGDRARVRVKTAEDGYLLMLRMTDQGRVRVLFPLDPRDDASIEGGHEMEIRSRGDREAFMVGGRDGSGMVLAAWSARPFQTEDLARNGHWDLAGLTDSAAAQDPEAALLSIVDKAAGGSYEYDVLPYTVSPRRYPRAYAGWYDPWFGFSGPWGWYGPGWYYGPSVRVRVGIGRGFRGHRR
jgi:Domain of unknown function (DUF4384)